MKCRVSFTLNFDEKQYIKELGSPVQTKFDIKQQVKSASLRHLLDLFEKHNIDVEVLHEE